MRNKITTLTLRIISGVILGGIIVLSAVWGSVLFRVIVGLGGYFAAVEWSAMAQCSSLADEKIKCRKYGGFGLPIFILSLVLIGIFSPPGVYLKSLSIVAIFFVFFLILRPLKSRMFLFAGLPYIGFTLLGLMAIHQIYGWQPVLFLISVVWATDTMAYVVGRLIGGPKLAPGISPNKTWAGFLGGLCGGIAAALLAAQWSGAGAIKTVFVLGLALSVLTQLGDLLESSMKRHFKVKDSGWLIPGHGGILDRVDGLLLATPVFTLYRFIAG